ncbi:MAG TPA: Gfo/Idh/MocA family oxidoreductase [Chloroflexota bacterium]|nr:Gfo/Idh/MocA family oxidoreductase [Chloroflexota bacterium]
MNDARASRDTEHTIRIGFIGCGGNARGHMRSLGGVAGARIVGVCDIVSEMVNQAAEQTGAQPYTEYNALLGRDDLDAVYISVPVFAHGAPEMAVIERGLPMLVEKPVALEMATAREIETAVKKANLLTCVGYQLRYRGSAKAAKCLLSARDAGPVGIVHGSYWCGTGRQHGATWRTQLSKSGGQILEQATHTLDMMRFLAGEVEEVVAYFGRAILGEGHGDAPDVHAVTLKFANGAAGTLSATWALDPKDWSHANLLQIGFGAKRMMWKVDDLSVADDTQTCEPERPTDGNIDAIFVEAVRTGDRSTLLSDYSEGVKSLALCLAINESARLNRPVRPAAL